MPTRSEYRQIAEQYMGDETRCDDPRDMTTSDLVRTLREVEAAARDRVSAGDIDPDVAVGIFIATAAVRTDYSIEDSRYVDPDYPEVEK